MNNDESSSPQQEITPSSVNDKSEGTNRFAKIFDRFRKRSGSGAPVLEQPSTPTSPPAAETNQPQTQPKDKYDEMLDTIINTDSTKPDIAKEFESLNELATADASLKAKDELKKLRAEQGVQDVIGYRQNEAQPVTEHPGTGGGRNILTSKIEISQAVVEIDKTIEIIKQAEDEANNEELEAANEPAQPAPAVAENPVADSAPTTPPAEPQNVGPTKEELEKMKNEQLQKLQSLRSELSQISVSSQGTPPPSGI